jgi:hypothetical protein
MVAGFMLDTMLNDGVTTSNIQRVAPGDASANDGRGRDDDGNSEAELYLKASASSVDKVSSSNGTSRQSRHPKGKKHSIFRHTIHTNAEALLNVLPFFVMYLGVYNGARLLNKNTDGFFHDPMSTSCAICRIFTFLIFISLTPHGDARIKYVKTVAVQLPIEIILVAILAWALGGGFGVWSNGVYTLTMGVSDVISNLIRRKKPDVAGRMIFAFVVHGSVTVSIYTHIIPTRLLTDKSDPLLTSIMVGAGFPILTFLLRKLVISYNLRLARNDKDMTADEQDKQFADSTKVVSCALLLTPTSLMYMTTSTKYAILTSCVSLATEVCGKVITMYSIKLGILKALAKHSSSMAGSTVKATLMMVAEPGLAEAANDDDKTTISKLRKRVVTLEKELKKNGWVESVDERKPSGESELERTERRLVRAKEEVTELEEKVRQFKRGEGEIGEGDQEKLKAEMSHEDRAKNALHMLALQWHMEIVGEKMSILAAMMIAYLHFDEMGVSSYSIIARLGGIYFGFEFITDACFVKVVAEKFDMPMLELELESLTTWKQAERSISIALFQCAMGLCIGMAAHLKL